MLGVKRPTQVRYQGVVYKIHDDYRNILHTIKLLDELDINDFPTEIDFIIEQNAIVVQTIFGSNAPICETLAVKANDVIWNYAEDRELEDEPAVQDLVQDYPVYKMDILREFNKDIEKLDYLSWNDFISMVGSLSADSNMAQYVKIRSTKLKDIDKNKRQEFKKIQDKIKIKRKEVVSKESVFDEYMRKAKENYNRKE